MGVHALAHSRTGRHDAHAQRTGEEVVTPECFNRIEVVLALHQQAQVGLQNIAVGDATDAHREFAVNAMAQPQAFDVWPNQCQARIGGEVVGQFFENKVGHVELTFRVAST